MWKARLEPSVPNISCVHTPLLEELYLRQIRHGHYVLTLIVENCPLIGSLFICIEVVLHVLPMFCLYLCTSTRPALRNVGAPSSFSNCVTESFGSNVVYI